MGVVGTTEIIIPGDDVEIEIDGDQLAAEGVTTAPKTPIKPPMAKEPVATPARTASDDAAAALQKTLDVERQARRDAETRAANASAERDRASREADGFRQVAVNHELTIITNGIDSANAELASAKEAYEAAYDEGDKSKLSTAQIRIAKAVSTLERLEDAKVSYQRTAPTETRQPVAPPPPPASGIERFISQLPNPRAKEWVRSHPDCIPPQLGGDRRQHSAMMQGHHAALGEGIEEGTDAYFKRLDEFIAGKPAAQVTEPSSTSAAAEVRPAETRRQAQPSAPVSREAPGPNGEPTRPTSVRLDAAQQEIALLSFPQKQGEDDSGWRKRAFGIYAREWASAKAEGKIGRTTH